MEKHNVIESGRTPGLEKSAETDIVDDATAVFRKASKSSKNADKAEPAAREDHNACHVRT